MSAAKEAMSFACLAQLTELLFDWSASDPPAINEANQTLRLRLATG
jgi:hypothetical protein